MRKPSTGLRRVHLPLGMVLLLFVLSGCGFLRGGLTANDPFRSQSERQLIVRVENTGIEDVSIQAVGPGRRVNMGRVQGRSIRQFSIPWASVQDVRFQIEPLGGRRYTTQAVMVGPGEFVQLVVTQPVDRSFVRR
jgi:uncharacterized protein with von Willebrand factor type A (vWA) domain